MEVTLQCYDFMSSVFYKTKVGKPKDAVYDYGEMDEDGDGGRRWLL